jgi:hypothetical protein
VFKKLWEKYDQWVAVVLTLAVLFGLIKLVLWAEPLVHSKWILGKLLGWMF